MKALKVISLSLAIAVGVWDTPVANAAGGDIGNHADYFSAQDGSAWFNEPSKVLTVCMQVSTKFGFTHDILETKIQEAYGKWLAYLAAKDVTSVRPPKKLVFQVKCNETEDLRFIFGNADPATTTKVALLSNPVAMSVRTSFDMSKQWSKGYIWLAETGAIQIPRSYCPDWHRSGNLEMILLHELGHTFGIGHIRGTIMDEVIARKLVRTTGVPPTTTIDDIAELVPGTGKVAGNLGLVLKREDRDVHAIPINAEVNETAANFFRLLGRKPQGEVKAWVSTEGMHARTLVVKDDRERFEFPILPLALTGISSHDTPVFKAVYPDNQLRVPGFTVSRYARHGSGAYLGTLTTANGKKLMVNVVFNMVTRQAVPLVEPKSEIGFANIKVMVPLQIQIVSPEGSELLFASGNGSTLIELE